MEDNNGDTTTTTATAGPRSIKINDLTLKNRLASEHVGSFGSWPTSLPGHQENTTVYRKEKATAGRANERSAKCKAKTANVSFYL